MLASVEAELLERIEASVQAHPIDPHQAQIFPLVGDLFALMAENREICAALLGPHGDMAFLLQIEAILSRYSLQVLADAYPDRRADLDSGYSFCPVSYTHLDVYKRQRLPQAPALWVEILKVFRQAFFQKRPKIPRLSRR